AGGVGGGATDGVACAAPIMRVKSLWTGWAGITGADGGRLMFAPGIGVADAEDDGGSGTTGGGPDHGLEGESGGEVGADVLGGGATTRSSAEVALGDAPLIGGGMNCGAAAGGGAGGSGSTCVAPKIRVNSPGAGALGGGGGGAAGLGGGGGGAAGGFGPLPGSRNRTDIDGCFGSGGLGSGAFGATFGGVHDTVGESMAAIGAPFC